jgi:hypothetical protein
MENKESQITLFEATNDKFQQAFENLVNGRTPISEVKQRPGRGGGQQNYVNTYYMTDQIGLLTGFRWSSKCLEERALPNWEHPREIGAHMLVTIWDKNGKEYSHDSWGQKDVAYNSKTKEPLSIFDDLKAAYSDGIKKCLSYFGIARDIYGGKELEFFADDNNNDSSNANQGMDEFDRYITKIGWNYDKVFKILNITSLDKVQNWKLAYETIKSIVEGKTKEEVIK